MSFRLLSILALAAIGATGLAGCATMAPLPPTQVLRYHLDAPIPRGTIAVEPLTGGDAPASLEFKTYAAAVEGELIKLGYAIPAQGQRADYIASVSFTRTNALGPPRRAPFTLGIGGGSYSGGYNGGVGLGGGVGIPFGGAKRSDVLVAELAVTIKQRSDMSPLWEGHAEGVSDISGADQQANKLAAALFTGFPGESGRTVIVK
ncbi:DUF4136 domain-containing protein [Sphingomonas oligophenolica]|uniref:DUF4136 domain-containing protein n=1 Tax=Sphingomonas oligophenolica TaxID=301154 RepID=A0A502CCH0_9SPHN|nr:DUF4136 domain-containing protein [Sphingomonas oligophenolica]TPG10410.1 DUF4136 domain-containing protein [Sphingomonas oligophenolica]